MAYARTEHRFPRLSEIAARRGWVSVPYGYALSILSVAVALALTLAVRSPFGFAPLFILSGAVVTCGLLGGLGPGLLAGIVGSVAVVFGLLESWRGLEEMPKHDAVWISVFLGLSMVASAFGEYLGIRRASTRERDLGAMKLEKDRATSALAESEARLVQQAEMAERERDERLRHLVDDAPIMLWVTQPDGSCTYLTKSWYEYTGQTESEAIGFGWLDSLHPDDRPRVDRAFRDASPKCEPFRCEYRLRRADGVYRWFLDSARPRYGLDRTYLGYIGSVVDIGERREAEEALRESEARMRLAQSVAQFGTWDWDPRADTSVCSTEWYTLHHVPASLTSPSRAQWLAHVHPDDRERVARGFDRPLERESAEYDEEYRVLARDGTIGWVTSRGRVVRDEANRPIRYMGVSYETTDRRQRAEQARQAQHAEALKRLAGGVAHEINNQMTVVLGLADFLLGRADLPPTARADIAEIRGSSKRAAEVAGEMLAFSRQLVLSPEVVDLSELIASQESMLRDLVGPRVRLSLALSPEPVSALADRAQLARVLFHLADNAREAMPKGGSLRIETNVAQMDERARRGFDDALAANEKGPTLTARGKRFACITVTDSGHGMEETTAARIFDPFFTTKAVGKGPGLGLATTYGIVKQHGGAISVESEPGRGTSFRVYLPLAEAPTPEATRATASPGGAATVLVVDDEEAIRLVSTRALELEGFRALGAANGVEALRVLEENEGEVALVLTDLVMPEMDGRELVRVLAERRPDLPVLTMSGYSDLASMKPRLLARIEGFLPKPFSPGELVSKVQAALERRGCRAER